MLDVTTLYRELYFARKSSLLKDAGRKGLTLLRPFNHEDAEARTITWQTLQEKQQMEQAAIDEEASFQGEEYATCQQLVPYVRIKSRTQYGKIPTTTVFSFYWEIY